MFLGYILGEGLGEALLVPDEGDVEDHGIDAVDVDNLGAHVCTSFPRPVLRLSTTAEQERGIIALCVDSVNLTPKKTRSGQSEKPMSIPRSWPSLSSPSPCPPSCRVTSLQLPSSEFNLNLVKYWCQNFRNIGPFWNTSIVHPPLNESEKYRLTCKIDV